MIDIDEKGVPKTLLVKLREVARQPEIDWVERHTQSPIERLFGFGLIAQAMRVRPRSSALWHISGSGHLRARAQVRVGRFRVDFVLRTHRAALVVELDGHEWHERTKQRALADKSRDRELLTQYGMPVIRFTGSEVNDDPRRCADEAIDATFALHGVVKPLKRQFTKAKVWEF